MRKSVMLGWLIVSFLLPLNAQAKDEWVFATVAGDNPFQIETLYQPLVSYLSRVTGKEIRLDVSSSYTTYAVRMRSNRFDLTFDDAHFTAWRIGNKGYMPLVRLDGDNQIVVVTRSNTSLQNLEDLASGRSRVCSLDSPSLVAMAFLSRFPNPAQQPNLIHADNVADTLDCLRRERGDVAVLSLGAWRYADQNGLRVLVEPDARYPEVTLSASPRVDEATRQKIRDALLSDEGRRVSENILSHYRRSSFVPASPEEYAGLERLLSSVWGF